MDFTKATLAVTRQVHRIAGRKVDIRPPKYGSERVVHLADGLVDLLRQHVTEFGTIGDEQWLFGENGVPPHQNSVGYWWRTTLEAAGVSGIKLHDLRTSMPPD